MDLQENFSILTESTRSYTNRTVLRINFITPKSVAAFDWSQISMRVSECIIEDLGDKISYASIFICIFQI